MATKIWVNIRSGNGLLPNGTKPLPEPTMGFWSTHIRHTLQEVLEISMCWMSLKIALEKLIPHLPAAIELALASYRMSTVVILKHYSDVIMSTMASQITSLTIVYSTVYSGADQRKHQSSASVAFVRGIHRWPVNSPHKGPVTRKMFLFDGVIMNNCWNNIAMYTSNSMASYREISPRLQSHEKNVYAFRALFAHESAMKKRCNGIG